MLKRSDGPILLLFMPRPARYFISSRYILRSLGPVCDGGPEMILYPESRSKISNLMVTELAVFFFFFLHNFNMNRGYLHHVHTRSFRRIHRSVFT